MAWPYSQHLTAVTGNPLTAADWNSEQQGHINNNIPTSIDDASATTTAMRTTADPGESGSESLATDLLGELQRLRFALVDIKGTTYWYETPAKNLTEKLSLSGGTMSGDIAMGTNKLTGLAAGSAAGHSVRFEQLKIIQVATATLSGADTTTTTDFSYSVLSRTITPTSASNKVLVIAQGSLGMSNLTHVAGASLTRNNTNLAGSAGFVQLDGSSVSFQLRVPCAMVYLDSPASTASVDYRIVIKSSNASGTTTWGHANGTSTLTVMEVA